MFDLVVLIVRLLFFHIHPPKLVPSQIRKEWGGGGGVGRGGAEEEGGGVGGVGREVTSLLKKDLGSAGLADHILYGFPV